MLGPLRLRSVFAAALLVSITPGVESFDQLQEHRTKEDKAAIKEMVADGHVVGIKSDSKIEIVMFSERKNAYQVRAFGSTQELWLAKENVFAK
jgi:hypothetical protein